MSFQGLFFFLSNWDGAPLGLGALRKLRRYWFLSSTISFISHRPDRKGTLASDLAGAGAEARAPWGFFYTRLTNTNWIQLNTLSLFFPQQMAKQAQTCFYTVYGADTDKIRDTFLFFFLLCIPFFSFFLLLLWDVYVCINMYTIA